MVRLGDWSLEETFKYYYYDNGLSLANTATALGVDKDVLRRKMIELDLYPRKNKEDKKRKLVRAILVENPTTSNRQLSRLCKCAHQTAARYKKEWEAELAAETLVNILQQEEV